MMQERPSVATVETVSPERADLARRIRSFGRGLDPAILAATQQLYAPLHADDAGVSTVRRDLPYGADTRQRLDVFHRPIDATLRPMLLFLHGGGFVRGDKHLAGTPFHDNVGRWAARQGMIGVTMTYRLAPAHVWPSGIEDVAATVAHLRDHAAEYGGDRDRIVAFGTSAGAVHLASYLAVHRADPGIAAAVLGSGLYDLEARTPAPNVTAYYGSDPARYGARSPLPGLIESRVPLLITVSELDAPDYQQDGLALAQRLFARDRAMPRFLVLQGHNHYSPALQLGIEADRDPLAIAISDLVANLPTG